METPAAAASWRREIFACVRCSRMYSPIEPTLGSAIAAFCLTVLAVANALDNSCKQWRCVRRRIGRGPTEHGGRGTPCRWDGPVSGAVRSAGRSGQWGISHSSGAEAVRAREKATME
ncbi:hypothetical protein Plo01_24200 [Planobispora longispora]|uniref:Uncharacterized protein n=1 Tax=Planobispora longispora TaxID=28887 RepID=A0A8J3W5M2_9ACTN|nr:hypothetical protein Plo01_24200 [Planobispora longispora]